jgi:hypothetical protein
MENSSQVTSCYIAIIQFAQVNIMHIYILFILVAKFN